MSVALTIATTDYDHFRDFRLGLVRAEGIEANWLTLGHHEIFSRFTLDRFAGGGPVGGPHDQEDFNIG